MASPNIELRDRIREEVLRQFREATSSSGPRPTIDSVHRVLGGSKLTIGQVINAVRDEAVRSMLTTTKIGLIPDEHQEVLQSFYAQLLERAEATADQKRDGERAADQAAVTTANQKRVDAEERHRVLASHVEVLQRQLESQNEELSTSKATIEAMQAAAEAEREAHKAALDAVEQKLAQAISGHSDSTAKSASTIAHLERQLEVQETKLTERETANREAVERQQRYEQSLLARVGVAENAMSVAQNETKEALASLAKKQAANVELEASLAVARSQHKAAVQDAATAKSEWKQVSALVASQASEIAGMRKELELARIAKPVTTTKVVRKRKE